MNRPRVGEVSRGRPCVRPQRVTFAFVPNDRASSVPSDADARPRWRRAMRSGLTRPMARWLDGRVSAVVSREMAEMRAELRADVATLVELTIELQRIANRLEAGGTRAPSPDQ
jgi:hypothetical protein